MTSPALFLARIRIRRRLRGYLGVAVLLGLTAGLGMLSIAGARRTQSAYPRFLRSTNASTFAITAVPYNAEINAAVAALPEVLQSRTYIAFGVSILDSAGRPDTSFNYETSGTFDGRYIDQDRFTPLDGRQADPTRADEVVINERAARALGAHVGQHLELGLYSVEQLTAPTFATDPPPPVMRTTATVVGIGLLPEEIVQDDADRDERLLLTPAYSDKARQYASYAVQGLVLRHGDADVAALEARLASIIPPGTAEFRATSVDRFHALQAVRPLTIALALFGLIAGLAGLVLVAQAIGRLLRADRAEDASLHVFGASPSTIAGATMIGPILAVGLGIVLAVTVAVVASPVMPIGPVRRVEVSRGIDIDLAVLAYGVAVVIVVLFAATAVSVWRQRPRRRLQARRLRSSRVATVAASIGLPPPAVTGLRAAVEPAVDSSEVPTRSVVIGAVIAVAALVGSLTFGASLTTLVDQPSLYGWNWDAAISSANGYGNIDLTAAHGILDKDPGVASWWGAYFGAASFNRTGVPVLGVYPSDPVALSLLKGRSIRTSAETVLGATTADQLHAGVGDTVSFVGRGSSTPLTVVGIATFPTIGRVHVAHTSLGVGAVVAHELVPGSDISLTGQHGDFGPNVIFVRYRGGVNAAHQIEQLRTTTRPLSSFAGLDVLAVQRPAEIVNASAIGSAPVLLGASLMLASMVSLTLALGASARQRRRELAILRTLGFSSGQLVGSLLWQASGLLAVGLVVGIPVGVVAGKDLWSIFAGQMSVVSKPDIPVPLIAVLVVSALLVANAAATVYGAGVRRLKPGEVLRSTG
ncbi:MAG: FtsX-like permease family protein [Ilumatobacteraceae bacterium]